ncbi:MAG: putative cardiolipin synthase YwiE [Chlamydiales bacterium]|nr:putative cardiolipin synthase YwiE [Chlamydiales bacterium]MCH9620220.1 putative cardiolipin synthase YwiE [Chlamydiales bacterium]MCH9623065.1 putative cardiolipin synthase YwiE [Chlamydiales bacterium]
MRIIRIFRWVLIPLSILFLVIWTVYHSFSFCPNLSQSSPVAIIANACQDDFRQVFLQEIESAKQSIHLTIYSFTDEKLLLSLQRRADEGIAVKVIHDTSSSQKGFRQLSSPIQKEAVKLSGLMHQKILVIDQTKVWIGSTNWTTDSLRVHENLVVGIYSPELGSTITEQKTHHHFTAGDQLLEFWSTKEEGKESLNHLIEQIDSAKKSLRIAMFTLTHTKLVDALCKAKERGVAVEVILDRKMAKYVSQKAKDRLIQEGVSVRIYQGIGTFHHKFAWIDETVLINGSANWTQSAFKRNHDCYIILYDLDEAQQAKMHKLWHITRALSDKQHLTILWQGPNMVIDKPFESIAMAA